MIKGIFDSAVSLSATISNTILRSPIGKFLHGEKAGNTENMEGPDGP